MRVATRSRPGRTHRLLVFALGAMLSCRRDIARPLPEPDEDAGFVAPTEIARADASSPQRPDMAVDTRPPVTCGRPGLACCPGNECAGGGCCYGGTCVANGTSCRPEATCLDGSCAGCGSLGRALPQMCCDPPDGGPAGTPRVCTATRAVCSPDAGILCVPCGEVGQGCCADGFCEPGARCDPARRCVRR